MLRRSSFHLLGAALVLALTSAAPVSAQMGRVAGVVKDEEGQALKGATITAENTNIGQTYTGTTDDKGRFMMIGLRAGTWRFIAQAPGFSPEAGSMPVRLGGPNPPISFTLKKTGVANFGVLGGITAKGLQNDLAEADALFKQARWDDAVAAYRAIMAKAPVLSVINLQVAQAYRNKKDHAAALAAYDALLKADPANQKATLGIAMVNMERGDVQAAEDTLMNAATSDRADREIYYNLAEMMERRNEITEARRWYEKASNADPAWGKPLYRMGLLAIQNGDTDGAALLLDRVMTVDPISSEAVLAKSSLESLKK